MELCQIGNVTIHLDGINWYSEKDRIDYYFYWWNWLPSDLRYWGFKEYWFDGPLPSFGFWFINWSWKTSWTKSRNKDKK